MSWGYFGESQYISKGFNYDTSQIRCMHKYILCLYCFIEIATLVPIFNFKCLFIFGRTVEEQNSVPDNIKLYFAAV